MEIGTGKGHILRKKKLVIPACTSETRRSRVTFKISQSKQRVY